MAFGDLKELMQHPELPTLLSASSLLTESFGFNEFRFPFLPAGMIQARF